MTIFGADGRPAPRPQDVATLVNKIVVIYLRHNLGDSCECAGCINVRERLAPPIPTEESN
jgi:hypothetical protein